MRMVEGLANPGGGLSEVRPTPTNIGSKAATSASGPNFYGEVVKVSDRPAEGLAGVGGYGVTNSYPTNSASGCPPSGPTTPSGLVFVGQDGGHGATKEKTLRESIT